LLTISTAIPDSQFAVKRKAVGIWGCKDCGKVKAGGAYTMKYVLVASTFYL
jgi:ribosomal protein L37AE/L43A